MTQSEARKRMDALRVSNAGLIIAEYLKERLQDKQAKFVVCTKDSFESHKGRCLEIQDLINYIESRG